LLKFTPHRYKFPQMTQVGILNFRYLVTLPENNDFVNRLSKRGVQVRLVPASDSADIIFPGKSQKQVCILTDYDLEGEMQQGTYDKITSPVMKRLTGSFVVCVTKPIGFKKVRRTLAEAFPFTTVMIAADEFDLISLLADIAQLGRASFPAEVTALDVTPPRSVDIWGSVLDRLEIVDDRVYQSTLKILNSLGSPLAFARAIAEVSDASEITRKFKLHDSVSVKLWQFFNYLVFNCFSQECFHVLSRT